MSTKYSAAVQQNADTHLGGMHHLRQEQEMRHWRPRTGREGGGQRIDLGTHSERKQTP